MANDLKKIYAALQKSLTTDLGVHRAVLKHPDAKGATAELNWMKMLADHLPHRYQVCKAFVMDSRGKTSQQIDLVVHDRQYTPMLFNKDGQLYIPAESVYGVFEVKQDISKKHVEYAGDKIASVRRLVRTSAPIQFASGTYPARPLFNILGGIVALECSWDDRFGSAFRKAIAAQPEIGRLDIGCAARDGSFEVEYPPKTEPCISIYKKSNALISFFMRLLGRLQQLATAPAIDYTVYGKGLK
jgi:hypothetical protein